MAAGRGDRMRRLRIRPLGAVCAGVLVVSVLAGSAWAKNITGSARNDVLRGTAKADRISGLGGDDKLSGLGGNDVLLGGAQLERDVVIAGVYDHLEIWDRSAWQAQMSEIEENVEDAAERVAAKRD